MLDMRVATASSQKGSYIVFYILRLQNSNFGESQQNEASKNFAIYGSEWVGNAVGEQLFFTKPYGCRIVAGDH